MKTKIIPFDAEMAKNIQDGKIKGRICTKDGDFTARIICFDKVKFVHGDGTTEKQIVSLIYNENSREDVMFIHDQNGEIQSPFELQRGYDLVLEVPDNESQFKPFDKVLGKSNSGEWVPDVYSRMTSVGRYICLGGIYEQIIQYEGHEHLAGTTDKPKEE